MKLLAVILASIAALAATAQTYFIWSGRTETAGMEARNEQFQRRFACSSLLGASAEFGRISRQSEDMVSRSASAYVERKLEYLAEEEIDRAALDEQGRVEGRQKIVELAMSNASYGLPEIVDTDFLYFTPEEREALALPVWREYVERWNVLGDFRNNITLSEEEFEEFSSLVAKGGEQYPAILKVCTPILTKAD